MISYLFEQKGTPCYTGVFTQLVPRLQSLSVFLSLPVGPETVLTGDFWSESTLFNWIIKKPFFFQKIWTFLLSFFCSWNFHSLGEGLWLWLLALVTGVTWYVADERFYFASMYSVSPVSRMDKLLWAKSSLLSRLNAENPKECCRMNDLLGYKGGQES